MWFGEEIEVWEQESVKMDEIIPDDLEIKKRCLWCHKALGERRYFSHFCCKEHGNAFRNKLKEITNKFYFSSEFSEKRDKLMREGEKFD